jgi:hypothetical protein
MEKVAKSFKLEAVTSGEVGHVDSVEGLGPASLVSDAFKKPVGSVLGPVTIQDRNVVYKVLDHQTADTNSVGPAERDSVMLGLKQQKAKTQYDLFLDSIVSKLRADKKLKIHPESMQRLIAQYKQTR